MRLLNTLVTALGIAVFFLFLLMAGLWWMPKQIGHWHQATPWQGAVYLVGAWIFVFNRMPSLGFRQIAKGHWFPMQIAGLGLATAGFAYGVLVV